MISDENKKFLEEYFKIDVSSYTEEELNHILDEIIKHLNSQIKDKKINILNLMKSILMTKKDN